MALVGWIEPEHVMAELGMTGEPDDRLLRCIEAAEITVSEWREDLPNPAVLGNVYQGGVRLSAIYYQQAATPSGFAGFEEGGGVVVPEHAAIVSIRQMVRAYRPKVG